MSGPSPFAQDWRDCLRAHYQQVVRNEDHATERTLVGVLQKLGFEDTELGELKVLATLRADAMSPDFVPDLEVLTAEAVADIQQQAAAPEEPQAPPVLEAENAAESGEEAPPESAEDVPPEPDEPPEYRADGPQQLSFF